MTIYELKTLVLKKVKSKYISIDKLCKKEVVSIFVNGILLKAHIVPKWFYNKKYAKTLSLINYHWPKNTGLFCFPFSRRVMK